MGGGGAEVRRGETGEELKGPRSCPFSDCPGYVRNLPYLTYHTLPYLSPGSALPRQKEFYTTLPLDTRDWRAHWH